MYFLSGRMNHLTYHTGMGLQKISTDRYTLAVLWDSQCVQGLTQSARLASDGEGPEVQNKPKNSPALMPANFTNVNLCL